MKILAIQFRYFGDAVLLVPALRALKEHFPESALHLLVPAEVTPIFDYMPWLARVWAMPRTRGRARLQQSWPILRALWRERFDRSVDFGGNDRGAILSLLCRAPERLAPQTDGGFLGRRFCYTQTVPAPPLNQHEVYRNLHVLSAWNVPPPRSLDLEIHTDPALEALAAKTLPERGIICHLAASQPKKEWPLEHWAGLFQKASAAGFKLIFSTGTGPREQVLLEQFRKLAPAAHVLPSLPNLASFLAVLKRAEMFISGDTGPLHFAAGLGVPTISLFGATSATLWAPLGPQHQTLQGSPCSCDGHTGVCLAPQHCLASISPDQVLAAIRSHRVLTSKWDLTH
jgi:ADP-heptose:LPS heptosyltransferase